MIHFATTSPRRRGSSYSASIGVSPFGVMDVEVVKRLSGLQARSFSPFLNDLERSAARRYRYRKPALDLFLTSPTSLQSLSPSALLEGILGRFY